MDYQKLNHTTWNCKYHIVFIPKRRKKVIFGERQQYMGEIFHELARQKECEIVEGPLLKDYVHICISIPPKYAVSTIVGYIKGKSAIAIARKFAGKSHNYTGESSGARGYDVSTVGVDEQVVQAYIRKQEEEDARLEPLNLPLR